MLTFRKNKIRTYSKHQKGGLLPLNARRYLSNRCKLRKSLQSEIDKNKKKADYMMVDSAKEYGIVIRALRLVETCYWRAIGRLHYFSEKERKKKCNYLNSTYVPCNSMYFKFNKDESQDIQKRKKYINDYLSQILAKKVALILLIFNDTYKIEKAKITLLKETPIYIKNEMNQKTFQKYFNLYLSQLLTLTKNEKQKVELPNFFDGNGIDFTEFRNFMHSKGCFHKSLKIFSEKEKIETTNDHANMFKEHSDV